MKPILHNVFDERFRLPCFPLVTGQTVSYLGNFATMDLCGGDDGYSEKGYSRRYEVRTNGQHSGTTNITINGKTIAMENDVVLDKRTGLMWMRHTPDSDIGPTNDGKLYWKDGANDEHIFKFCHEANKNSLGGFCDWRVPNYHELTSILDLGQFSPCIDATVFPGCPSDYFWVSSTRPDNPSQAFIVNFSTGPVGYNTKAVFTYYCRLCRNAVM